MFIISEPFVLCIKNKEFKIKSLEKIFEDLEVKRLYYNNVNKGITLEEMIKSGKRIKESGIQLSLTVILRIGKKDRTKEHAVETGRVLSEIDPDYVGLLTLLLSGDSNLNKKI